MMVGLIQKFERSNKSITIVAPIIYYGLPNNISMPLALSSLQTGHSYSIRNYGEEVEFEVVDIRGDGDVKVKHLYSREIFLLSEITRYGKGKDYDLQELDTK